MSGTRYYFTSRIYDAAGNVLCWWCGRFYENGRHYCRAMANAIPRPEGGFVVAGSAALRPEETP